MNSAFSQPFDNTYSRLSGDFFSRQKPDRVSSPALIKVNRALAQKLGIDPDWLQSDQGVAFVAGNYLPDGTDPIATVYAGHQFGGFSPRLGDGRAILLGEIVASNGQRYDIQLKGSGRTPYSRGGDGRAPLGPVLREYVVSEAMAALGVPTTRALAAVTTGDLVMRETPLPGAVLARVAKSHLRIGTLQYFAARNDLKSLQVLVNYVIRRHYPEAAGSENPVLAMLNGVIRKQAGLIAQWQALGFIHGVMNTDNMLLSGETIDYGPCAFLDEFEPDKTFSSIDQGGRYAYANQPRIAHWNLSVLAQLLLPLINSNPEEALVAAQAAIDTFPEQYQSAYFTRMRARLGFLTQMGEDAKLIQDLLILMQKEQADYTLTFRLLSDLASPEGAGAQGVSELIELPESFSEWLERWKVRISNENTDPVAIQTLMYASNPAFIPRNHLLEEVIVAATTDSDFKPFERLVDALSQPFDYQRDLKRYALPPREDQVVRQTFCGT